MALCKEVKGLYQTLERGRWAEARQRGGELERRGRELDQEGGAWEGRVREAGRVVGERRRELEEQVGLIKRLVQILRVTGRII